MARPKRVLIVGAGFMGSEMASVCRDLGLDKIGMLVEHFTLDEAASAYQLLHDGKIQGHAVITPHG